MLTVNTNIQQAANIKENKSYRVHFKLFHGSYEI
jgi:hypothetical protein